MVLTVMCALVLMTAAYPAVQLPLSMLDLPDAAEQKAGARKGGWTPVHLGQCFPFCNARWTLEETQETAALPY